MTFIIWYVLVAILITFLLMRMSIIKYTDAKSSALACIEAVVVGCLWGLLLAVLIIYTFYEIAKEAILNNWET